jgi:citrate lyase beta subunit
VINAYQLGASLYVPATHASLGDVMLGRHPTQARSVIVCTEDAIAEADLDAALEQLDKVLASLPPLSIGPLRFVRPRSPAILNALLRMRGIGRIHGFVIPKADADTLPAFLIHLDRHPGFIMPILETAAVFDRIGVEAIRQLLCRASLRPRILAIRIGGNDLLRLLGLRRTRGVSIYETPVGALIPQLLMAFRPWGFHLTGVAYDCYDDAELLRAECRQDRLMGLIAKTAIHPRQVEVIQTEFSLSPEEIETAQVIMERVSEGAFGMNGMMLEPAVHSDWAREVLSRPQALQYDPLPKS